MDAFYASVEQLDRPELRGKAVAVGGGHGRGVVAAASHEARQHGIHSAMPVARARRLCPDIVVVSARFARYREVSARVFEQCHSVSDCVEGLSLDEAYLDVSGRVNAGESLAVIGRLLKQRIAEATGLTASVGMAHNKLLAKIASDYDKPDGFVIIGTDSVQRYLDPLPVRRLWGIGPRTAEKLRSLDILTVGQLRNAGSDLLEQLFGQHGREMALRAAGIDNRAVTSRRVRRSISQETTFEKDVHDLEALRDVIRDQAGEVAGSLARRGLYARTIMLKLRSGGFSTISRSRSLPGHTRSAAVIGRAAVDLLESWAGWHRRFAIRLIGVGASGLASHPDESELLE